jgi:hypothetical protein
VVNGDGCGQVRATAAKAMGSLLHGMGEAQFRDLVPWLLAMLRSEGSTVERSGAAQGLSEVLAVLGVAQLEALLPDIIQGTYAKHAFTREGHQTLFRYLPIRMEAAFQVRLRRRVEGNRGNELYSILRRSPKEKDMCPNEKNLGK